MPFITHTRHLLNVNRHWISFRAYAWLRFGILGCLLVFLALPCVQAKTIKVASWNVRNYLLKDRYIYGSFKPDYPKPESEKAALREAILAERPDILLLQEMGGEPFVRELQQDLKTEGLHYTHLCVLEGRDSVRMLAVLSQEAIHAQHLHKNIKFRYFGRDERVMRGLMELHFVTEGIRWTLYNIHLKSRFSTRKQDPQSAFFREGEARAIRNHIREHPDQASEGRYLLMGDFNDHIDSPVLSRFLKVSDQRLAQEIPLKDQRGESWTYYNERSRVYEQVDFALAGLGWRALEITPRGYIVDRSPEELAGNDHRMIVVEIDFLENSVGAGSN